MPVLKASRFLLRPYRKGDEASLQQAINDKEIARNILTIPYPYTIGDARFWIRRVLKLAKQRKKTEIDFVIDIRGEVAGSVSLFHIDGHQAEVGYWLARKHWGQGLMTEAVLLATRYAFETLKLRRLYAYVFPPNKASIRVLEKCGFLYEGTLRKHVKKDGKLMDDRLYAKVR